MEVISRDKANGHSTQSHSATVLSLVEGLYLKLCPRSKPVPRVAAAQGVLEQLELQAGQYVVIHCGARHMINRWPWANSFKLAALLHESTGLPVVMFTDDGEREPAETRAQPGLIMPGKMPLAAFDTILSNARLMIGNDSGPKHLATTRGVWTASIHINRLNWKEWGQNGRGIMISKKVPCAGCGLNDERLCGKDVACLRSITVDEVFNAIEGQRPWTAAADI
jgi:ADP-heptose:LPS heptosyltransferase